MLRSVDFHVTGRDGVNFTRSKKVARTVSETQIGHAVYNHSFVFVLLASMIQCPIIRSVQIKLV